MYKVFLADDEVWVVMGLKKLIQQSGEPFYVIGEANNGLTALEEIKEKKPDVVFTDIRMPGIDGLSLLNHLAELEKKPVIILISGYAKFEYVKKALRYGVFDYLLKPMELEPVKDVLSRIKEVLVQTETKKEYQEEFDITIQKSMLQNVLNEIHAHFSEDISLVEIGQRYHLSGGYLSKLLKKEFGMSFIELLTSVRIQKAKELLSDETLSVLDISERVGYNDYYYFTKVFKKEVGITPSKYRKML